MRLMDTPVEGIVLEARLTTSPQDLTFEDAMDLLFVDTLYDQARAFYDEDPWQDGTGWIGPTLDENDEESTGVMEEIRNTLVSHSAIQEVVDRHRDAVASEPNWGLVPDRPMVEGEEPNTDEARRILELTAALETWWDEKEALDVLQEATIDFELGGRGLLRVFVPEGELVESPDGTVSVPGGNIQESLERIWPLFIPAKMGEVLRDPLTMKQVGVYVYEVIDVKTGRPTQLAELCYLDDTGRTVIRVIGEQQQEGGKKTAVQFGEAVVDLNGRLTIYKIKGKRLVTDSAIRSQKLLNMDLTMMGRNVVLGGFLERVILNGQRPGNWEEDSDGNKVFVPAPYKSGAASTNWIGGAVIGVDPKTNQPIVASPSVVWRDPVGPDAFTKTQDAAYANILHATRQLHVLIAGNATISGESRKQARDDYEKSLKRTKTKLDAAGRWLVEVVLMQACLFAGKQDMLNGLRVWFDAQIDAGPLAANDRTAMQAEVTNGLRSIENYMVTTRVTQDPKAEKTLILQERANAPAVVNPPGTGNPAGGNPPNPNPPANNNPPVPGGNLLLN